MTARIDPATPFAPDVIERFLAKIDASGDCWQWTAGVSGGRYGSFLRPDLGGKAQKAHRVAWELLVGPIPDGLQIDHLCKNTLCVNPDHLEPVTARVNVRRSAGVCARNAAKTACKRGHVFTEENTMRRPTGRRCKTCHAEAGRESMRRYRAKEAARVAN